MNGVIHLAAPEVEANGRLRQRCAWCGATLIDHDLANVSRPLEPGEDPRSPVPWKPATWAPLSWVRVDGRYSNTVDARQHPDDPTMLWIPEESCMAIDPTVTV